MTKTSNSPVTNAAKFGGIMVASLFLSRVLGLARDTVMVAQFGVNLNTDAYQIAARIPDTIFMLIAGGGLSSAFIPVFSGLIHKDREEEAWEVFGVVTTLCSIIAAALIAIAWVGAPWIVKFFQGTKPDSVLEPAIAMSRVMLPAQFAFLVGSLLLATLYARKQFLAPGLAPNVYNLGIILGAGLLPAFAHMGVESLAWGALVGAMIGNLVLPIFAMRAAGSHFKPGLNLQLEGVRQFFKLLLPVIVGFSLPSMITIITQWFASKYGVDGLNTILQLSNNLMQAPLGIFGQALALAIFPVLSEYVARERMDLYRDQISKTLRTVLYLGFFSGGLMLALAPQVVHALYGWGSKHTEVELGITSQCLRLYSLGIFAWCVQPVLMRGFFSLHKTFKPVAISTSLTGGFIALSFLALYTSTDYRWLTATTNFSVLVLAITLFFALEREVGKLDRKGIGSTIIKSAISAAAGSAVAFAGTLIFPGHHGFTSAVSLVLWGLVGFWTFFFVSRSLKMPETEYLDRALTKVGGKFGVRR